MENKWCIGPHTAWYKKFPRPGQKQAACSKCASRCMHAAFCNHCKQWDFAWMVGLWDMCSRCKGVAGDTQNIPRVPCALCALNCVCEEVDV